MVSDLATGEDLLQAAGTSARIAARKTVVFHERMVEICKFGVISLHAILVFASSLSGIDEIFQVALEQKLFFVNLRATLVSFVVRFVAADA